ncbi:MAG: hypothetical protein AAFX54_09745 [Pseudomonadota bacterium]
MINKRALPIFRQMLAGRDAMLNMPVARKVYRRYLKRGYSVTVSLLAAIAASRVSAAANELDDQSFDALAGLQPVNDLTGFGEACLPGQAYASTADETHDHSDSRYASADHSGHFAHAGSSYLANPFTSRFDSPYSRGHDGHDQHQADHDPGHGGSVVAHVGHASSPGQAAVHAGHVSHDGHQAQSSHYAHAGNGHSDHAGGQSEAMSSAHAGHNEHDSGNHAGPSHQSHAAHDAASHTSHSVQIADSHSGHEAHNTTTVLAGSADVNADTTYISTETGGAGQSENHQNHSVALADVIETDIEDNPDHGHHSHMEHGLTTALMDQAPTPDPALLAQPPEI